VDDSLDEWREVTRAELTGDSESSWKVEVCFSTTEASLAVACGRSLRLLRLDTPELERLLNEVEHREEGWQLDAAQIVEVVLSSSRIAPFEVPIEPLLIFETPKQRTWLVMTQRSICIVLDDPSTRRDGNMLQRVMPSKAALPPYARLSNDGTATVAFGTVKGHWLYSPSLHSSPGAIKNAILARVAEARRASKVDAHALLMRPAPFTPSGWAERIDRDSSELRNWLSDLEGEGIAADAVSVVEDARWETLRAAMANLFARADAAPVDSLRTRRLYVYLACNCIALPGDLRLMFAATGPDGISATLLSAFRDYLEQQLERKRYSEIVLLVDGVLESGKASPELSFNPQEGAPLRQPPAGSSFLSALLLSQRSSRGESLASLFLRQIRKQGEEAEWSQALSGALASRLSASQTSLHRIETWQRGPEFLIPGSVGAVGPTPASRPEQAVSALVLPEEPQRASLERGPSVEGASTQVIGAQLAEFTDRVSAEDRKSVSNCLLLAQLAANRSAADQSSDVSAWYDVYSEALRSVGWTVDSMHFSRVQDGGSSEDLHQRLRDILAERLGPQMSATDKILDTLESLKSVDKERPWLTLFNREAVHAKGAKFQLGSVDVDPDGLVRCRLVLVAVEGSRSIAQILFFRSDQANAELRTADCHLSMSLNRLRQIANLVAERVEPFAGNYVAAVGLPASR